MSAKIRRRVIYHGRVQGVFFRASTQSIASRFAVTGYVRNLPAGTVELVVEGPVADVEAFLVEVGDHFSRNVTQADVEAVESGEPMAGFQIRH